MMKSMLKVEENKKKGGIGVSSKTKPVAESATTSKATTKPTASELLAVKLMTIQKHQRKCRKNWRSSDQTFSFHLKNMKRMLQMTKKMKQ